LAIVSLTLLGWGYASRADDEVTDNLEQPVAAEPASSQASQPEVELARQRAKTMQELYAVTLDVLHQRYFHRDKSILPARAMEDIFDEIERQSGVQAHWISASLKPMSIDHKPADDFERRAAKEIAAGTPDLEAIEGDRYRRALAIPLASGCLGCHQGLGQNNKRQQFAGLVITVPLR